MAKENSRDMAQWMIKHERKRGVGPAQARRRARDRALWFAAGPTMRGEEFWREVAHWLRYATTEEKESMRQYYRRHRKEIIKRVCDRRRQRKQPAAEDGLSHGSVSG